MVRLLQLETAVLALFQLYPTCIAIALRFRVRFGLFESRVVASKFGRKLI